MNVIQPKGTIIGISCGKTRVVDLRWNEKKYTIEGDDPVRIHRRVGEKQDVTPTNVSFSMAAQCFQFASGEESV